MKKDNKLVVFALVMVALAVWGFNARELFVAEESEDARFAAPVRIAGDAEIRERMKAIAKSQPRDKLELRWDPFARKRLVKAPPVEVEKPKPSPEPKAPPKPPPKPKPPPFLIKLVAVYEGETAIYLLIERGEVNFARIGDWVGVWLLESADDERLTFVDEHGNRQDLIIGEAAP